MAIDRLIAGNTQIKAGLLSTASPLIAGLIRQGKLRVIPAHYGLATGKVTLLADDP